MPANEKSSDVPDADLVYQVVSIVYPRKNETIDLSFGQWLK